MKLAVLAWTTALLSLVSVSTYARTPSQMQIEQIDRTIAGMRKLLPIRNGPTQYLTDVYRHESTIHYTVQEKLGNIEIDGVLRKRWEEQYAASICGDNDMKAFLLMGFSITADLINENAVPMAAAYVDIESCKSSGADRSR